MQDKKSTKTNKLEEISNLKSLMSLNDSLFEATKTAIKTKNNEIALKMIDNLSDRPDLWTEYVTLAILWQNFPVFKQMVEKFNIDLNRTVNINAAMFNNELHSDPSSKSKPTENKENYQEVECPLAILTAIGGDIDIYKYLTDRGVNCSSVGHIGLSKKLKNSVISNVIGASAFYGRINLLHFILEKTGSATKLDINHKSIEKKSKTKQYSLHKEFADFTPVHLALNDLNSEDDSIEILKLLQRYNCDMSALDWNKNNILHIAVKFNKKRVVKFILEDLKFLDMVNVSNKEGQTAMAIAKSIEASDILNYLQTFTQSSQAGQDLDQELLELIENTSTNKKKTKKDKKKKEENLGVLGTINEFQETLKPPKEKPVETPKVEEKPKENKYANEKANVQQETYLEKDYANKNENNEIEDAHADKQYYERKSYFTNYYTDNKLKKNYKYGYNTANSASSYKTDANYSNRSYEKDYNDYDYDYTTYQKDNYYGSYNKNSYGDDKKYGKYSNTKPLNTGYDAYNNASNVSTLSTVSNTTIAATITTGSAQNQNSIPDIQTKQPAKTGGIVGLTSKSERKNIAKTIEKEKELLKDSEKEVKQVEQSERKASENKIDDKGLDTDILAKIQADSTIESKLPTEAGNAAEDIHSALYQINKIEEQEHENEDDYMGEENFLTDENAEDIEQKEETEHIPIGKQIDENLKEKEVVKQDILEKVSLTTQTDNKITLEQTQQTIAPIGYSETNEKELKVLTANCFDLQKEVEFERKANEELRAYIKSKLMPMKVNIHQVQIINSEENISDILQLANEELNQQSKRIFELNSKLEFLEGKSIKNSNENDLNTLKDFYSARLGAVIDSLNNLKSN